MRKVVGSKTHCGRKPKRKRKLCSLAKWVQSCQHLMVAVLKNEFYILSQTAAAAAAY